MYEAPSPSGVHQLLNVIDAKVAKKKTVQPL
jgi:hypothetical protein